nr:GSTs3 [Pagiophloeus tsushimanus]
MPSYKVIYFELTGLAEAIRFLLSYGGLEFEDERVTDENWPDLKPSTPLGNLPLLEVDGKVLYQSTAIARYLGKIVGLAGETDLENWEIDAVADTITDLRTKIFSWYSIQDEEQKQLEKEILINETLPFFLTKFDEWAEQNGGYLAAERLTWVDLLFVATENFLSEIFEKEIGTPFPSGYSNIDTVKNNVLSLPNIQAWLDTRPPSKI